MNTYIVPVADISSDPYVWIEIIKARSLSDAQDKIIDRFVEEYELNYPIDWEDFITILYESNLIIGEIKDIEEF